MELATLVAEALLAGAESTEVFGGLGDYIVEEVEVDTATLSYKRKCQSTLEEAGEIDSQQGVNGR